MYACMLATACPSAHKDNPVGHACTYRSQRQHGMQDLHVLIGFVGTAHAACLRSRRGRAGSRRRRYRALRDAQPHPHAVVCSQLQQALLSRCADDCIDFAWSGACRAWLAFRLCLGRAVLRWLLRLRYLGCRQGCMLLRSTLGLEGRRCRFRCGEAIMLRGRLCSAVLRRIRPRLASRR